MTQEQLKEKLTRLSEIRKSVSALYREKNELESEVVEHMVLNGIKTLDLDENKEVYGLKWIVENKIDYEKLERDYNEVYELGLQTCFSATKCLDSVNRKLFNEILNDCTIINNHYELKRGKK